MATKKETAASGFTFKLIHFALGGTISMISNEYYYCFLHRLSTTMFVYAVGQFDHC